jgi:hypothetical protein
LSADECRWLWSSSDFADELTERKSCSWREEESVLNLN